MNVHKRRLLSVSVLQTGIVLGALYALIALLFSALLLIFGVFTLVFGIASEDAVAGFGGSIGFVVMAVFLPVMYGVMGLISGIVVAAGYNLIAKVTGGLVLTVVEEVQGG